MKRCIHCETLIEDPRRTRFCSNWCSHDHRQPEEYKSLDKDVEVIKDGVYVDDDRTMGYEGGTYG